MPCMRCMQKKREYRYPVGAILTAVVAILAALLQGVVGDFPVALFSFPLNILAMVLWLVALTVIYRNRSTLRLTQMLMSRSATWLSLLVMAAIGLVLGLQRQPSSASWPVVVGVLYVMSHLYLITLRGMRAAGRLRWRFTLLHLGLLLALGAGFWGAADRVQLRMAVDGRANNVAYTMSGEAHTLDYYISLKAFNVRSAGDGEQMQYEATVVVDKQDVVLRVNHPYSRTWAEKIYIVSHGAQPAGNYVVVEIVTEPWQWLSAVGIVMLIVGAVMMFLRGPRRLNNNM